MLAFGRRGIGPLSFPVSTVFPLELAPPLTPLRQLLANAAIAARRCSRSLGCTSGLSPARSKRAPWDAPLANLDAMLWRRREARVGSLGNWLARIQKPVLVFSPVRIALALLEVNCRYH